MYHGFLIYKPMLKSPIAVFILKVLAIFIVWYLIYEMWLLPDGRLDEGLSLNIIGNSAGILRKMGFDVWTVNRIIGIYENPGIEIVNGCNGISSMGLFIGFILSYPGDWKNKISFSLIGVSVIYFVNIIRIVVLVITQEKWPEFFHFTHDYSTTTIFYIVIFLMWMLWVKLNDADFNSKPVAANA